MIYYACFVFLIHVFGIGAAIGNAGRDTLKEVIQITVNLLMIVPFIGRCLGWW